MAKSVSEKFNQAIMDFYDKEFLIEVFKHHPESIDILSSDEKIKFVEILPEQYFVFDILPLEKGYLVVSKNYQSPIEQLDLITARLKLIDSKYNGPVLFDLIQCVGFSNNRFISSHFNGQFDLNQFKVIQPNNVILM